jgi:salicylate hydroxylase
MYFADGTTATADAVIGCDGIKSKVRASIMNVDPQYGGGYVYRSLVDVQTARKVLGEKLATNATIWAGYGGYAINYPVEKGNLVNVVACVEDVNSTQEHSIEQLITPTNREKMYEDWKDWDPRLQGLLREFKSSDQWSLWHLPHDEKYFKGRICLLGDAAHAAVPHLGSGAGMAIEDGYVLGNLLVLAKKTEDLEKAFAAYDLVRRPRTQKVISKSKEAGTKHSFMLEGVGDNFEALQAYARVQYRWIWNHNIEKSLSEARQIMEQL